MPEVDIGAAYNEVIRVTRTAPSVGSGMAALLDHCDKAFPGPVWSNFRSLPFEQDTAELRTWLEGVLTEEPPPPAVKAYWFGMFQSIEQEQVLYNLYLSGATREYTPDSLDWACWTDDTYLPKSRYTQPEVVNAIFNGVQAEEDAVLLADYALCLGFCCLALTAGLKTLPKLLLFHGEQAIPVVVGFEDGDDILLGHVGQSGWMPVGSD